MVGALITGTNGLKGNAMKFATITCDDTGHLSRGGIKYSEAILIAMYMRE